MAETETKKPRKKKTDTKAVVVEQVAPAPEPAPAVEVVVAMAPEPVAPTEPNPAIHQASYTPKNPRFVIRCQKCRWATVNGGTTPELKHLYEIPNNCASCGKARKFRCPNCGSHAKMDRVKGA